MVHCFPFGRTFWKWTRPTFHMFFIFLTMGAPDFSRVLYFFRKYCYPFTWSISFLSIKCTLQVGQRQGKSGNFTINFQIQENQRISPFFEKIRDTSGYFITDKGKIKDIGFFFLISLKIYLNAKWGFHDFLENVRSRLWRSHILKNP